MYKWDENYLISTVWIWIMEISNDQKVWKTVQHFKTSSFYIFDINIKRDFKIVNQMSFMPPFYATQIINPFLTSRISANHDKVDGLLANGAILIEGIVSLL